MIRYNVYKIIDKIYYASYYWYDLWDDSVQLYYALIVYFYLELISLMEVSCVISCVGGGTNDRSEMTDSSVSSPW